MKSVPAQVIAFDSNKKCIWRDCKVLDYNGDENTYLVCWIDTGQTSWIPRCCIVPLIVYGCYKPIELHGQMVQYTYPLKI